MAKAPAFQFYVRDWLCSRKVSAMSGDAVKAYMYLLSESWLHEPRATLPNDDQELALMARVSCDIWERVKHEVMRCFKIGSCKEHLGLLYNERLLEVSRNYEKNQRPNNKNALRTRNKREPNAKKRTSSSSSSSSSITILTEQIPPISPKGDVLFDKFWSAYPRKVAKGDAKKAWIKIKETAKILEKIMVALEWQKKSHDWTKDNGQWIPYPASYLNSKRWEDQPMQPILSPKPPMMVLR